MRMKRGDDEIVMGMLQSGFVLLALRLPSWMQFLGWIALYIWPGC